MKNIIKLSFVFFVFLIAYFSVGFSSGNVTTGFTIKGVRFEPSNVVIDSNIADFLEVND
ncbi:MAG: hypothetical protein WC307_01150 [Candidatus Nanoarchaeia archaeon]